MKIQNPSTGEFVGTREARRLRGLYAARGVTEMVAAWDKAIEQGTETVVVKVVLSAAEVGTLAGIAKARGESLHEFVRTEARCGVTNMLYSDDARALAEGGA